MSDTDTNVPLPDLNASDAPLPDEQTLFDDAPEKK